MGTAVAATGDKIRVFGMQEDNWQPPSTTVFVRYNLTQKFPQVSPIFTRLVILVASTFKYFSVSVMLCVHDRR